MKGPLNLIPLEESLTDLSIASMRESAFPRTARRAPPGFPAAPSPLITSRGPRGTAAEKNAQALAFLRVARLRAGLAGASVSRSS